MIESIIRKHIKYSEKKLKSNLERSRKVYTAISLLKTYRLNNNKKTTQAEKDLSIKLHKLTGKKLAHLDTLDNLLSLLYTPEYNDPTALLSLLKKERKKEAKKHNDIVKKIEKDEFGDDYQRAAYFDWRDSGVKKLAVLDKLLEQYED